MRASIRRVVTAGLLVLAPACSDDPFEPTDENVAGAYDAETFTTTTSTGTTDLLATGAEATITLAADGTTTGRLFLPGGNEDGSDFDADLTGTWTLADGIVTFDHESDTFIRDVEFTAGENRLTSQGAFGPVTYRLVLRKQG